MASCIGKGKFLGSRCFYLYEDFPPFCKINICFIWTLNGKIYLSNKDRAEENGDGYNNQEGGIIWEREGLYQQFCQWL